MRSRSGTEIDQFGFRFLIGLILVALFVVGTGAWSTAIARHGLLWFSVGSLAYFTFRRARTSSGEPRPVFWPSIRPEGIFEWVVATSACGCALAALVSAWAPSTSWDAAAAHLALPKDYVREGRIALQAGNAYSAYPHLLHALYTAAFSVDGERGPALIHWTLSVMAMGFAASVAHRIAGRTAAWVAAAIVASAPIFADQAGSASVDFGFAAFVVAAWAAVCRWDEEKRAGPLIIAAIIAGSACGIRHTGYLVVIVAAAAVLMMAPRKPWHAAQFVGIAAVAAAPWLIRSAWLTGNPVYPFFETYFATSGPVDDAITAVAQHESLRGISLTSFLLFPWQIIMMPSKFDGIAQSPGPWVLLLSVPALIWGGRSPRILIGANVAGGAALFFFRQYARYYLPFFVPLMAVAGVGLAKLPYAKKLARVLFACGCIYGAVYAVGAVQFKIPVVVGLESRDDYLTRRVERYPVYQWINGHVPPEKRVLVCDYRGYYIRGRTFQNLEALYPLLKREPATYIDWFRENGIHYWMLPEAYVRESPGFAEGGLDRLFKNWRSLPQMEHVKTFEIDRPGGGQERVILYQIAY